MISKEELKTFVDKNLEYVKEQYQKNNGSFTPMVVLSVIKPDEKKTATKLVYLLLSDAIDNRFDVMKDLGRRSGIALKNGEIEQVEAIFTMSEAWISAININKKNSEKEKKLIEGSLKPSQDPDRLECIFSVGMTNDGETHMKIYQIKKNWTGQTVNIELKDLESMLTDLNKSGKDEKNIKEESEEPLKIKSSLLDTFWDAHRIALLTYPTLSPTQKKLKILQNE